MVSHKRGHAKLKKKLENGEVLITIVPMHGNKKIHEDLLVTIYKQAGHDRGSFLELVKK